MREAGLIYAASLALQGQNRVVQPGMLRCAALAGTAPFLGEAPCSIAEASWR